MGRQTKRVPQRDIGIVVYTHIAFFLFYTPPTPNEALIVKKEVVIIKSKVLIVALRIDAFIVILSEAKNLYNNH